MIKHRCSHTKLANTLKAFCDHNRLAILSFIVHHGSTNVSKIVKHIKLTQPTVSHHLKILSDAKIITPTRKGKEIFYSVQPEKIEKCCDNLVQCTRSSHR